MTTGSTPFLVPKESQAALQQFFLNAWNMSQQNWNIRETLRQKDLAYMREVDWTTEQWRAKLSNLRGDPTKFQNIIVPIIMPQVEAAVTYLQGVYLEGNPIFGVTSTPQFADAAVQMDSIMEQNAIKGSWSSDLTLWFRDTVKYNVNFLETAWETQMVPQVETDTAFDVQKGKPLQVSWSGNVLRRWDPYNTFWDNRCDPKDIPEHGEFCGKTELFSRIRLKKFINTLPKELTQNVKEAFESGVGGGATSYDKYFVPFVNPFALLAVTDPRSTTDWMAWAGLSPTADSTTGIQYRNMYQVTTLYARIMPIDFGLKVPAARTPQVWKLIFVNSQILIYAERQTNAHDLIPVFCHQALEDGLTYQTKSFQDNAEPFQNVASALLNSAISARRRALTDRVLYDPSRINEKDINNPASNAKIPVRPSAYGKPLGEAVYAFPFRDDQSQQALAEMQQMMSFANIATGQNQAQQGQFVKGNKTLHEYSDVMGNAQGRNRMIARGIEDRTFSKVKEVLKLNILQYQTAGTVYSTNRNEVVSIDPVALRQAVFAFKLSDGMLPSDKLISADTLGSVLQYGLSNPQLMAEYNFSDLFTYLMKMQGADLKAFEKSNAQVEYEKAANQWQQTVGMIMQQAKPGMQLPAFPPQPTPQQFGYDPNNRGGESATTQQQSILQQVIGTAALGSQNPNTPAQAAAVKSSGDPLAGSTAAQPSSGV